MIRRVVLGLLPIFLLSGCGGTDGPALYDVRGKVTWDDGKPIPNVVVTFAPTAKGVPTSAARTNDSGDFILTTTTGKLGAGLGKYKVMLVAAKMAGGEAETAESMANSYKNPVKGGPPKSASGGIPADYSSADRTPIEIEVTGSKKDLELTVIRGASS